MLEKEKKKHPYKKQTYDHLPIPLAPKEGVGFRDLRKIIKILLREAAPVRMIIMQTKRNPKGSTFQATGKITVIRDTISTGTPEFYGEIEKACSIALSKAYHEDAIRHYDLEIEVINITHPLTSSKMKADLRDVVYDTHNQLVRSEEDLRGEYTPFVPRYTKQELAMMRERSKKWDKKKKKDTKPAVDLV